MRNTFLALAALACLAGGSGCALMDHCLGRHCGKHGCDAGCADGCCGDGCNCPPGGGYPTCGPNGCGPDCAHGGHGHGGHFAKHGGHGQCGPHCGPHGCGPHCRFLPDCQTGHQLVADQLGGPAGPPTAHVTYPYYTTRGPRDFLAKNPPSIGP